MRCTKNNSHFSATVILQNIRKLLVGGPHSRACPFLVSVFDAVSGESLAELHHSGAQITRAGAASSPLFFLAAVLARSGQVLRWRHDELARVPRESLVFGDDSVTMTKTQCSIMSSERRCRLYTAWTFLSSWHEGGHEGQKRSVTLTYYVNGKKHRGNGGSWLRYFFSFYFYVI